MKNIVAVVALAVVGVAFGADISRIVVRIANDLPGAVSADSGSEEVGDLDGTR